MEWYTTYYDVLLLGIAIRRHAINTGLIIDVVQFGKCYIKCEAIQKFNGYHKIKLNVHNEEVWCL